MYVTYVCMYACMYVCMYPCTSPLLPSISRKKHGFSSVFAKRTSKNIEFFFFSDFRQKDAGSLSQQKSRQGESSLVPLFCSPKTTFSGTSSDCHVVRGGPPHPPPPQKPTYLTSGGGGGKRTKYPLSSNKYPTRRTMSADIKGK